MEEKKNYTEKNAEREAAAGEKDAAQAHIDSEQDPKSPDDIGTEGASKKFPSTLPVLPQHGNVVFPGMAMPAHVKEDRYKKMLEKIVMNDKFFIAVAAREGETSAAEDDQLYSVGTACVVVQMARSSDGSVRFIAQGLHRAGIDKLEKKDSFLQAKVSYLEDRHEKDDETEALVRNLKQQFLSLLEGLSDAPEDIDSFIETIDNPARLADLICSHLDIGVDEKQEVLETLDVKKRLTMVGRLLAKEIEYMQVTHKIRNQAIDEINKGQKEYYLRHQLKAIQEELGETDVLGAEVNEIKERLEGKNLPAKAREAAEHELKRLEAINPASPEYNVVRTYLDWILKLPWLEGNEENLDLEHAREILDEDHFGLEKVKERIQEFLAVRKLRKDMKGSILCFLGPPGTGKTSIGKSIARSTGREYVRVSLGGVRDEAEIKGHRRTYIGALPGQIIMGINKAGSNNPVFMLDEVDKLSSDFRGDPASALLEALDPEQNDSFTDHYLDLHFDLSRVLFICTANIPDTIPPALKDRMEMLDFPGYTEEEKLKIAEKYLIPKQIEAHGLSEQNLSFTGGAVSRIISEYTREAGVRNLERNIASVCRKVARKVAAREGHSQRVSKRDVDDLLGPPRYIPEVAERVDEPGVATGLAWTSEGGMVMFVEANKMPGDGKLTLTGQLGDVMKESAQAAITYIRAHTDRFGLEPEMFQENDFHIHVPAGAIPKDGPSAGVTMALALVSLCTGRKVKHNVAMTGEITLRGKVLPVGGVKEKAIAAKRAGLDTVIIPQQNEKDMPDVPRHAKKKLEFRFVDRIDEIMPIALED